MRTIGRRHKAPGTPRRPSPYKSRRWLPLRTRTGLSKILDRGGLDRPTPPPAERALRCMRCAAFPTQRTLRFVCIHWIRRIAIEVVQFSLGAPVDNRTSRKLTKACHPIKTVSVSSESGTRTRKALENAIAWIFGDVRRRRRRHSHKARAKRGTEVFGCNAVELISALPISPLRITIEISPWRMPTAWKCGSGYSAMDFDCLKRAS